jgi:hypothetical protein
MTTGQIPRLRTVGAPASHALPRKASTNDPMWPNALPSLSQRRQEQRSCQSAAWQRKLAARARAPGEGALSGGGRSHRPRRYHPSLSVCRFCCGRLSRGPRRRGRTCVLSGRGDVRIGKMCSADRRSPGFALGNRSPAPPHTQLPVREAYSHALRRLAASSPHRVKSSDLASRERTVNPFRSSPDQTR